MVLDTGDEIYIWIGSGASDEEKEKSLEIAEVNTFIFYFVICRYRKINVENNY